MEDMGLGRQEAGKAVEYREETGARVDMRRRKMHK
jgi:hypothetical protein